MAHIHTFLVCSHDSPAHGAGVQQHEVVVADDAHEVLEALRRNVHQQRAQHALCQRWAQHPVFSLHRTAGFRQVAQRGNSHISAEQYAKEETIFSCASAFCTFKVARSGCA